MGLSKEMFIDPVPDGYLCAICLDVLQEPTFVECVQEHVFCKSCIYELIRSSYSRLTSSNGTISCPTCRERVNTSNLRVSKFVKRLVGNLNVRCANQGCDWVGSCMDQGRHETMCLDAIISCPSKGCHMETKRRFMNDHLKNCTLRNRSNQGDQSCVIL